MPIHKLPKSSEDFGSFLRFSDRLLMFDLAILVPVPPRHWATEPALAPFAAQAGAGKQARGTTTFSLSHVKDLSVRPIKELQ